MLIQYWQQPSLPSYYSLQQLKSFVEEGTMTRKLVGKASGVSAFNKWRRTVIASAAFIAGVAAATGQASGAESVNVTFIAGFPPGATFVGSFVNGYMQAVDAALAKTGNYKINWNLAHSGQIAKPRGELEAIQGGLGDIAAIPTPYYYDRVPLYEVLYVTPFSVHDPAYLTKVFAMLEDKFPQFHQAWAKINQKTLIWTPNADNYVLSTVKPGKRLSDLKGMKIGAVGPNAPWISAIGVTPVQTVLADFYTGMTTGLFEGVLTPPQALGAFKLCQPAKYLLDAGLGASGGINLTVNISNFWSRLPEEVKNAFVEAAPVYDRVQIKLLTEGSKAALDSCRKQHGLVETKLPEADRVRWAKSMPNIAQQWAQRMERQGLPGKAVLKFYMDAMRANKESIARHWDRE
jgi:TRAP-type C4-dicarboxylate transport system substrate-binding protein